MKKIVENFCVILLTCFISMQVSAFAEGEISSSVNLATATVTVKGTIPDVSEPVGLTLATLNPNKDRNDISASNLSEYLNHIAFITTEADGSYSYSYEMSGVMGKYQSFIVRKDTGIEYVVPDMFSYISADDLDNVTDKEFDLAVGSDAMSTLLTKYVEILPTTKDNISRVAAYLAKDIEVNGEFNKYSNLQRAYREALLFIAMSDSDTTGELALLMEDNEDLLPFVSLNANDAFVNILDDSGRGFVLSELLDSASIHLSDWTSVFTEQTILHSVKTMTNWRSMESLLIKNRDTLEAEGLSYDKYNVICTKDVNDKVDTKLAGNSYTSLKALSNAVNSAISSYENGGNDDGKKHNTGSGGSGSGSVNIIPSTPKVELQDEVWKPSFTDMEDFKWAVESVNYLAERGIVNGRTDNTFDPDAPVTREEFVKMIVLAMNPDASSVELPFTDVDSSAWYYDYVKRAYANEIINGISDNVFGVGDIITREDMAVIICRVLENEGITLSDKTSAFTDESEISDYARDSVDKLVNAAVINGMGDGSFAPLSSATRAQSAAMLYKMLMFKEG